MGKLKDLYLSTDTPPDAFEQYYKDISLVLDNNETAQIMIGLMCERVLLRRVTDTEQANNVAVQLLARKIEDLYIKAIDYVSRETAQNTLGNMLVQQMCYNMPLSVFEKIARDYLTDYKK